jgi:nicotinamide phosphoribosyltransferase
MIEHLASSNFILTCDGYKACHWKQIPTDVDYTYTVMVPRQYADYADEIVSAGQHMIASYLASVRITEDMVDEAQLEIEAQGYEFYREGWMRIVREFDGKLPLKIFGVEEGRIIKPQTPMMGWINSKPGFAWLVGDVETIIQCIGWKMTTVASICRAIRKTLYHYAEMTDTKDDISYMLHNFGDRGADAPEAAVLAAMAHAMLFNGSDCLQANRYIKKLYRTQKNYTSSIDASEHYTMTSNSNCAKKDDYGAAVMMVEQLEAAVRRVNETGIGIPFVSVVIDTFDDIRFADEYLGQLLKDRIINSGGRLIGRPDSGDATTKPAEIGTIFRNRFGATTNAAGFDVLHPAIGVIQGDGVVVQTHEAIIKGWVFNGGFSLDNFCMGMGSGVTHDGRRDDFSFSVKAIANKLSNGHWQSLLKDPKTDSGKKSLTGLARCRENQTGELEVIDNLKEFSGEMTMWVDQPGWRSYFDTGFREYRQSFDDVQARARAGTIQI